jgi:hypothetical protein
VTLALSVWVIIGLFVDGWAHVNLEQLETFFTPWHALFYSGFAAVAAWIGWKVVQGEGGSGARSLPGIPVGYGLGVAGLVLFAVGGFGDALWHIFLGIETELDALLSPTHLLLFAGMALIVTSPLRAAWAAPDDRDARRLTTFLPAILSLTLLTALISFFFMYASAFSDMSPVVTASDWAGSGEPYPGDYFFQYQGITTVLISNVILIAPLLYLLRRWQPPFGSATVLFTLVAVLVTALMAFETAWSIVPAAVGGLAADLLIHRLRPAPEHPAAYRMVAAAVPAILWSAYYVAMGFVAPIAWVPELWSGTIVFASFSGFALAQLMLPTTRPQP